MTIDPQAIGMAAGLLTTFAFVPQALAIWRAKSARGVSAPMYAIFLLGIALWFLYGLMLGSLPIMLYNAITFVLAAAILAMRLRFGSLTA